LLGWAYLLTAQWQACVDALAEAEIIAKESNDDFNSLLIRNLMGMAYAATGDYMQALKTHQYCLALVEKRQPRDPFFLCHLYNQLGQHHAHLNEHDAALDAFQQALAIIEELNKHEHLQPVYIDIALQYAAATEYEQASISFYKCMEIQNQRKLLPLQSEIYRYLGQALMMGDQEKARTYLEGVLQHHSNDLDALTQASILTNLAEWFLLNNHLEEAEQYAEKACKLAQLSVRTLITSDALIMRGRIRYAQAKYENGDEYFAAGLEMLEELNLPEEQSSQLALYAQLLDEQGKTKEALKYYKKAYERKRRAGEYF
jgi:tetratricopeptide (TPR) repeat protein